VAVAERKGKRLQYSLAKTERLVAKIHRSGATDPNADKPSESLDRDDDRLLRIRFVRGAEEFADNGFHDCNVLFGVVPVVQFVADHLARAAKAAK
jgi:hypothetical protein